MTTAPRPAQSAPRPTAFALLLAGLCWLALLLAPGLSRASDDPPGRVGGIVSVLGDARLLPGDGGEGVEHPRESLFNWPLTSGDLLETGHQGTLELSLGSTRLRLADRSRLLLRRVDDEAIELQLLEGRLALRLRSDEAARELLLDTRGGRLRPLGRGAFEVDAGQPERRHPQAIAWVGHLRLEQRFGSLTLAPGQGVELDPDGGWRTLWPESDELSRWALAEPQRGPARWAQDHLAAEMSGLDDLARHGDWERHPDWGWVWLPGTVATGWVPYREGRWIWRAPWGWTWVDAAPWGFAPFHYGRWAQLRGRWAWVPGPLQGRVVWAPALVVWSGPAEPHRDGGWRWFPLAPRETYLPAYACSPQHLQRLNAPHVPLHRSVAGRLLERPDEHLRGSRFEHAEGRAVSFIGRLDPQLRQPGRIQPAPVASTPQWHWRAPQGPVGRSRSEAPRLVEGRPARAPNPVEDPVRDRGEPPVDRPEGRWRDRSADRVGAGEREQTFGRDRGREPSVGNPAAQRGEVDGEPRRGFIGRAAPAAPADRSDPPSPTTRADDAWRTGRTAPTAPQPAWPTPAPSPGRDAPLRRPSDEPVHRSAPAPVPTPSPGLTPTPAREPQSPSGFIGRQRPLEPHGAAVPQNPTPATRHRSEDERPAARLRSPQDAPRAQDRAPLEAQR